MGKISECHGLPLLGYKFNNNWYTMQGTVVRKDSGFKALPLNREEHANYLLCYSCTKNG